MSTTSDLDSNKLVWIDMEVNIIFTTTAKSNCFVCNTLNLTLVNQKFLYKFKFAL